MLLHPVPFPISRYWSKQACFVFFKKKQKTNNNKNIQFVSVYDPPPPPPPPPNTQFIRSNMLPLSYVTGLSMVPVAVSELEQYVVEFKLLRPGEREGDDVEWEQPAFHNKTILLPHDDIMVFNAWGKVDLYVTGEYCPLQLNLGLTFWRITK